MVADIGVYFMKMKGLNSGVSANFGLNAEETS
jgi:hypothetical protein